MTTSEARPPVKVSSLVEFCELIPLMLGFQPRESVVLVVIRDLQMVVAARFDLPPTTEAVVEVTRRCAELGARHDGDQLVLIGFSDEPHALWGVLDTVVTGLHPVPTDVVVTDHRWWWESADDPGRELPDTSALRAHQHFAGRRVLDNREELLESIGGPHRVAGPTLEAMTCAEQIAVQLTVPEQMTLMHDLLQEYGASPRELGIETCIMAATLVDDPFVREHARLWITRRNAEQQLALWRQVVAATPDEIATGPLCLLAMAAFLNGDGALQHVCLERAELLSPGDETVAYLSVLQQAAVDPRSWDRWSPDQK